MKLTNNQKDSELWWSQLSVNEMKDLVLKYYPDMTLSFVNVRPSWIEDIYNLETNQDYKRVPLASLPDNKPYYLFDPREGLAVTPHYKIRDDNSGMLVWVVRIGNKW